MNILILASGPESFMQEDGYPLCLAEFDSLPLIQHIINACEQLRPYQLIVAFRVDEIRRYHLDNVVQILCPDVKVISVQGETHGAVCTALLATGTIDNDRELLIISGNELLDASFLEIVQDFRKRKLDAGVAVFKSIHPRYSYVKLDEHGLVIEASEKKPISKNATVGFYWFRQGKKFVSAAKNLIRKDARVNGKFYICPTFNQLVLERAQIGIYSVDNKVYHPLKTVRQFEQLEAAGEMRGKL